MWRVYESVEGGRAGEPDGDLTVLKFEDIDEEAVLLMGLTRRRGVKGKGNF